jgi:tRNA pseudouridine38-40 synthase
MYILTLAFCGKRYHGWQSQENAVTIQRILRDVVAEIFRMDVPYPSGCSRTDAGVHALEFIATVPELRNIPPESFQKGLNSFLPDDIRVIRVERLEGKYDGREFVAGKHYRYMICMTPTASPFASDYSWHSAYPLDVPAMQSAVRHFVGIHDFATFMASGSDVLTTVRTIHRAKITDFGDYLALDFTGDGFLKHQIRIISGTLVNVGRGKIAPDAIPDLIAAKDRNRVPHTLPGCGLFLYKLFRTVDELTSYEIPTDFKGMVW